jgi:pimeloyl-ACP methyl ester carboxylesterase
MAVDTTAISGELMLSRRSILKGAAAVAGLAAVEAAGFSGRAGVPGGARLAVAADAGGPTPANVLLVHGAWADGSSWSRVIPILQELGHNVLAVQLPMTSIAADVAWTRHVLAERLQGPTVLAGHSYGGAVISGAATGSPNVISLAYIAALAPDEGETASGLVARFPTPPGLAHLQSDSLGFLWLDPAALPANYAQDVELEKARVLAAVEKPLAAAIFGESAGPPAWRTLPSWFLVSTRDRMIDPDLQRFMAARMSARTVEISSSHASPFSHPDRVARLIRAAAQVRTSP